MPNQTYYLPYNHTVTGLNGPVWYATWTRGGAASWSQTAPSTAPNMSTTFAACVAVHDSSPSGAALLGGGGTKDLPPPPQTMSEELDDIENFKTAVGNWLIARGAGDSL